MSYSPALEDDLPVYSPPPPPLPRHDLSSCDSYFSCTRSTGYDAWASPERPLSNFEDPAFFGFVLCLVAGALILWASLSLWNRPSR